MTETKTAPAAKKQRIMYFDMLKGIAIFLVVMGHVLTMGIRGIDRAFIFKLIGEIHMPVFFFISGWFTLRIAKDGTGRLLPAGLGKRFLQLIIPMVAVSSIWIYYFPHSGIESPLNSTFAGLWGDIWKNGYWFTLCLFEIILLYCVIFPVLKRVDNLWLEALIALAFWAAFVALCLNLLPADVQGWLSLQLVYWFFPVFMAGWICRRHKDQFMKSLKNSWMIFIAMVLGGCAFYAMAWPWEISWLTPWMSIALRPVMHICLAIVAFAAIIPWSEKCFSPQRTTRPPLMARLWARLGEISLGIYLLHYFFLFPMGWIRPVLEEMALDFVPLAAVAAFTAILITAVTWLAIFILKKSKITAWLLVGDLPFK